MNPHRILARGLYGSIEKFRAIRYDMRTHDKQILITGASSGIGAATAIEIARRGGHPVLVARRSDELARVSAAVRALSGREPLNISADLTRADDRGRVLQTVRERIGYLDILVNNAGITAHGRFDESNRDVLRKTMELNFFAVAEITAGALPLLRSSPLADRPWERGIVLVSTPSGLYGVPGRFAYSASKAAAHALMETLRTELYAEGIHSSIFCPGYTRTDLRQSGLAADGGRLQEEQADGAIEPAVTARRLLRTIEGGQRIGFTGLNGHLVYWLRTLAPGFLERVMRERLKKDFEKH